MLHCGFHRLYCVRILDWQTVSAQGERPRCLARDLSTAARRFPGGPVEVARGDITQSETLGCAMQGVDTIVHAGFRRLIVKNSQGTQKRPMCRVTAN